ncbi:helix-turn-helix domain-containing protein [Haloarcula nitratireducens]|uniref:Helix-turn-helix domain-containing protein n=1 Tax=Haloarcula nitratireducens TaxID=2487749 RepID=A0AAW4PCU1_9EURY|nr:helix-turn-helix domain-containing protein [Halomicroarcula nitratireducens]MBX0295495.1 helix-turn-helix domain-containing protein [Halomicroarcula nitratireducens]
MIADFHVESACLRRADETARDVSIQRLHAREQRCRLDVWVDESDRLEAEAVVSGDDVREATHVGAEAGGHWFVVEATDSALLPVGRALSSVDGMLVHADRTDEGWAVRARFADRSAVLSFREDIVADGVTVDFRSVLADDDEPSADFGVTAPQREVLLLAAESGYFAVPRDASLSDLAARLDISSQAASERLRRGTGTLVANTLASPHRPVVGSRHP